MKAFIGPAVDREQYALISTTLDDAIDKNHPVRVTDWILSRMDWAEWISSYKSVGAPAYPPDVMSKLLVYGYSIGIRSSRDLEYCCKNNLDFIWLMSGRKPDHDTIAAFRRAFEGRLVGIFRDVLNVCSEIGLVSMNRVAVDGTRVEANNSRHRTMDLEGVEKEIARLDDHIREILTEAAEADRREDNLFGSGVTPNELPRSLKDAERRKDSLEKALEKLKARDGKTSGKKGKRAPVVDADSEVMKDKRGGFGPNYNAYLAVDAETGIVVSAGVNARHTDSGHFTEAVEEAERNAGVRPEQVLADSAYATVANIEYCEGAGIDPCIAPVHTSPERKKKKSEWPEGIPETARHADGTIVNGPEVPRGAKGLFDKSAFSYDPEKDQYICPLGYPLKRKGKLAEKGRNRTRTFYLCASCGNCQFRGVCTTSMDGRSVGREAGEEVRTRHAQRMNDPKHKADYKRRRSTVEPAFGTIKQIMKFRMFSMRGLKYVRAEWMIACAAFNVRKIVSWATCFSLQALEALAVT